MKKITTLVLLTGMLFSACKNNRSGDLRTAGVTVKVNYPATYSQQSASQASVTITSIADGSTKTAAAGNDGQAVFSGVLPGSYHLSATRNLTAQEALTLTGVGQELTLNAASNNVTVSGTEDVTFTLELQGTVAGSLLIKEVYYTGSKTVAGGTYFSDQFVEIYNNSTDTLYLDSLCIGDAYGNSGLINPNSLPTPFNTDNQHVYLSNVWRIPGTGKDRKLAPGRSIIIAQDGVNHKDALLNPASPVDLSKADWEAYNERPDGRDADAPAVPNLERVYFTGGFDWLLTVFGPGVVIFRANFESLEKVAIPGSTLDPRIKVPNSAVIDAFEGLKDAGSVAYKRIPTALDAGFVYADDTYNMQSFRRKTATTINGRKVLQDTNNSSTDFEKLAAPTPKVFQ
ncbi:DUF4876 domain-containing protein [Chitinophaga alhagiae]|uniref:DUF4876 domain-containing protein n=1 Tax=Chitinophaga alhagiae TaxID=2203219 RepID=UPI000E5B787A|nr:DUF4876 domain-containing protein [Chitinophaga alhagiae]